MFADFDRIDLKFGESADSILQGGETNNCASIDIDYQEKHISIKNFLYLIRLLKFLFLRVFSE